MGKSSYWWDFKSLISMWSWTRWIENQVVNVTQLWYNRVALLCSDGISNHLFACEAEPDECEIKLLSLLGSGIVELFCNLLLPSTDQLLMQFSSSFSDKLLLIFRNFLSEVGVISLSSQVRNSFSSLKYIENFIV